MPLKKTDSITVYSDSLVGEKVIITGEIEGQTRKTAEQALKRAGATVEKSLNKKVTLVVIGEKPGPDKLAKIEELGCRKTTWDELMDDIKVMEGEIGDIEDDAEEEPEPKPKPKKSKAAPKAAAKPSSKAAPKAAPKAGAKATPKTTAKSKPKSTSCSLNGKTVIVTGKIPGHERKEILKIVEDAGATVAKSLNKSVELVILGIDPGPTKLEKINEMGIETIGWDEVAKELNLEIVPQQKVADVKAGDAPGSIDGMTLLITGEIEGHTRSTAQKVLEKEGAKFAKSVTNAVELVVLGLNPGPEKLEQIKKKGIETCHWVDLVKKLDIDDDAPPKKRAKKN